MLVQPFELPKEISIPSLAQQTDPIGTQLAPPMSSGTGSNPVDTVSRFLPPWLGSGDEGGEASGSIFGEIGQLLQQLGSLFSRLMGGGNPGANQQYFQSATGASVGDPHLSFNGNTWDNMASQPDLLRSNSFPGGYRVSTQTTAPGQNGVTYNERATITSNYAMTRVSLDKNGNTSIVQNGQEVQIAQGQTLQLGAGETVSRTPQGLQMTAQNDSGGTLTTTLTADGTEVNVACSGSNVDLGGTLVNGNVPTPTLAPTQPAQASYPPYPPFYDPFQMQP